jgi:hypothetical protein
VLDADPRELEALRASGNLIEERVLPFEDVFIALASERPALEPSHV